MSRQNHPENRDGEIVDMELSIPCLQGNKRHTYMYINTRHTDDQTKQHAYAIVKRLHH